MLPQSWNTLQAKKRGQIPRLRDPCKCLLLTWRLFLPVAGLKDAYKQDTDIGPLLNWLVSESRPLRSTVAPYSDTLKYYWAQWDSLHLKEGVVHRLWKYHTGDRDVSATKFQQDVFHQLHRLPSTGHFGVVWLQLSAMPENISTGLSVTRVYMTGPKAVIHVPQEGTSQETRAPTSQYNVEAPTE